MYGIVSFKYSSVFILCPLDLFNGDNGVLKSPTTSVGINLCLKSYSILFMKLNAPEFGTYIFMIVISSWLIVPLIRMK